MTDIQIEKGVPISVKATGFQKRPCKYPWDKMEVGDSFLVPTEDAPKAFRQQVSNRNKFGMARFSYRTTPEGVRVWRVR